MPFLPNPCCEPKEYSEKEHIRALQKENQHLYEQLSDLAEQLEAQTKQNRALRALIKEIV